MDHLSGQGPHPPLSFYIFLIHSVQVYQNLRYIHIAMGSRFKGLPTLAAIATQTCFLIHKSDLIGYHEISGYIVKFLLHETGEIWKFDRFF